MTDTVGAELDLEPPKVVTAETLRMLLRRKFPADQFAMLYEVRDAAGFAAQRSADVMCIGLWPSRGCAIEGMEIKISRGDWLRELKKPEKGEAFIRFCDRWWIVAANKDIVKPDELPPTWGLMIPRGNGLGVVKPAPELKSEPLDRFLLAAMMKRATDMAANSPDVRARIDVRVKELTDEANRRAKYAEERGEREALRLREAIDEFQKTSGVQIDSYNGRRIGEAVAIVLRGDDKHRLAELERLRERARSLVAWFDENLPEKLCGCVTPAFCERCA